MKVANHLIKEIKKLTLGEKEELYKFLERHLAEERRENINLNFQKSKAEYKKRKFSSNFSSLKKSLQDF